MPPPAIAMLYEVLFSMIWPERYGKHGPFVNRRPGGPVKKPEYVHFGPLTAHKQDSCFYDRWGLYTQRGVEQPGSSSGS